MVGTLGADPFGDGEVCPCTRFISARSSTCICVEVRELEYIKALHTTTLFLLLKELMAIGRCDCVVIVLWDLLFVRLGVDISGCTEDGGVEDPYAESKVDEDLVVGTGPCDCLEREFVLGSFSIMKLLLFRLRSLKKGIGTLRLERHSIRWPVRCV